MKNITLIFAAIVSIITLTLLSACDVKNPKQTTATIFGGVAGAVAGSHVGKGRGQIITGALGSVAGSAIGAWLGEDLDKKDLSYHNNTVQQSMEENETGATSSWNNPDSGKHGMVTPVKTYTSKGRYCREYTQEIYIGKTKKEAYGVACRKPDGTWEIEQ